MWPAFDDRDGVQEPKILSPPTHVIWKQLEDQVKKGKIRSIGISNASAPILVDLLAGCEIRPAVNQFECHPYFNRADLIQLHRRFNIYVECYASIARGGKPIFGKKDAKEELNVLTDPVIVEIAKNHNKTPA